MCWLLFFVVFYGLFNVLFFVFMLSGYYLSFRFIMLVLLVFVFFLSWVFNNFKFKQLLFVNFIILYRFLNSCNLFSLYYLRELSLLPIVVLVMHYSDYYYKNVAIYYYLVYTIIGRIPLLLFVIVNFFDFNLTIVNFFYLKNWEFLFFMLPFLIKLPLFGLHLWLPKLHVMAPVGISMILARIVLKLGVFGLIFFMEMNFLVFRGILILFSLLVIFIISQLNDAKVFVAYSSVFHITFFFGFLCLFGSFFFLQSFNLSLIHRFISPLIFLIVFFFSKISRSRGMFFGINNNIVLGLMFLFLVLYNINFPFFPSFFIELYLLSGLVRIRIYYFVILFRFVFFLSGLIYFYWFLKIQNFTKTNNLYLNSKYFYSGFFFFFLRSWIIYLLVLICDFSLIKICFWKKQD